MDLYNIDGKVDLDELDCPFLNSPSIPQLTTPLQKTCEGELSHTECFNILSSFHNNKSPGSDGLTIEFYRTFWPLLGGMLVDCLNYSYRHGELSTSQKQAIITLIEKKGKDRRHIQNWRPISLINTDVKIGSKCIAKRLEEILPQIIHHNQNAYVKDRTIFDSVRSIDDLIHYTKIRNIDALLTAIDFQKAFDSLNRSFLIKPLKAFNFGKSFISWVEMFYTNIKSCVINNGVSSPYFDILSGIRQGDPLSPFLFIISLELLSIFGTMLI